MCTRSAALVAAILAVMVLGLACGGTATVVVVVTPTVQPATPTVVVVVTPTVQPATARSENVSPVEEADVNLDDAMADVARLVVELAYVMYGPDLCDIFRVTWPDLTTVSSQAEATRLFYEAVDVDPLDYSPNETARRGELIVEECARQEP